MVLHRNTDIHEIHTLTFRVFYWMCKCIDRLRFVVTYACNSGVFVCVFFPILFIFKENIHTQKQGKKSFLYSCSRSLKIYILLYSGLLLFSFLHCFVRFFFLSFSVSLLKIIQKEMEEEEVNKTIYCDWSFIFAINK